MPPAPGGLDESWCPSHYQSHASPNSRPRSSRDAEASPRDGTQSRKRRPSPVPEQTRPIPVRSFVCTGCFVQFTAYLILSPYGAPALVRTKLLPRARQGMSIDLVTHDIIHRRSSLISKLRVYRWDFGEIEGHVNARHQLSVRISVILRKPRIEIALYVPQLDVDRHG